MRRVLMVAGLAGLAILTLRATPAPQSPDASYYFDGALVTLNPSETEVVARFAGGASAVSRFTSRAPGVQVSAEAGPPDRRFSVLGMPAPARGKAPSLTGPGQAVSEAARLLDSLRGNPDVDFIAPVFHYPGTGVRILPTDEVIVRLRPGDTVQDLSVVAAGYGLTVERPLDGTGDQFVLRMIDGKGAHALSVSRALHESGRFRWAEPNVLVEYQRYDVPNDPLFPNQWHLQNTGQAGGTPGADAKLVPAWDIETGSSAIVVAVIDDGMDLVHEDLAPNLFSNAAEINGNGIDDDGNGYIDDVHGWDFFNMDSSVQPTHSADGHGTAVAGVAAARGNNGIGVTGACRTCRILPVKIFEGAVATTSDRIANAITYAASFADVINNSWGGGPPSAAIQTAIANANTNGRGGKGAVVMFATGNSASGLWLDYPFNFTAGTYGFQFEYSKDINVAQGFDTSYIAWVLFPGGELVTFQNGLPAGWTTGGSVGWSSVVEPTRTDEGFCLTRAAKAGAIGDSQVSTMQVTGKTVGAGLLYVYHWTSSELGFDGLRVKIDADNNGSFETVGPLFSGQPYYNPGISYPAAHPEAIAVGASTNRDCRSDYSQFGPELAFVAPSNGSPLNPGITTTDRTGSPGYSSTNYTSGFGGTSSATPLASGIAALVLSRNPDLTRSEVLTILRNGADKIGPEPYVSGRNNRYGHGRLNAYQSLLNTPDGTGTPPAAFNKTAPSNGATGQSTSPTLSWGASSGAASYQYCLDSTNNNACDATWTSTGTNTSVGPGGLSAGTTYYWQVRAINGGGTTHADGATTAFWSFATANVPGAFNKTAPASGATGQSTSPTLGWGTSTGATSYEYCLDTTNNNSCDATWTSTGTNTSVGLSGLSASMTYYWQVRSTNGGGTTYANGNATSFWSFTTTSAVPGAFTKTAPSNGATGQSTSPTLSWGASSGATAYEYCIDTSNNNTCNATWISTGTNTSVGLSGLAASTTYYWQVRATNGGGTTYANGSSTAYWSFTTTSAVPGAFNKTSPANGAPGQSTVPTLSWGASSGVVSYQYCLDTTNNNACDTSWISTGAATSAVPAGLAPGTTHYWQVRAVNPGGTTYANGATTAFWSFTTSGTSAPPFGLVDTPVPNATVQGSIGVTGWALDDQGVTGVKVYRNCLPFEPGNCQPILGQSLVFIGDAVFVEGARPDVAAVYPTYPHNTRAGWGYLLLTSLLPDVPNSLPYGGEGPVTLYAVATDAHGQLRMLGRTTLDTTPTSVTMANATIAKPFGAIDTPAQGQTISGIFNNFGWALTPDLNTVADGTDIVVPVTGSTMTVFIDGLPVGQVAYNQCRGTVGNPVPGGVYCNDDVSSIFGNPVPMPPGTTRTSNPTKFRNLDAGRGSIGAFTFDSRTLADGLHTIVWSVTDSAGRAEGIGSRFFRVANGSPTTVSGHEVTSPATVVGTTTDLEAYAPAMTGVWGRTGYDLGRPWTALTADAAGVYAVRLPELGRLELWLGAAVEAGYVVAGDTLQGLPVGASLEGPQVGWTPPPGYVGTYDLVLIRQGGERVRVRVTIVPPDAVADGASQVRMQLGEAVVEARGAGSTAGMSSVRLDGWAFDPQASLGAGIGAVHMWATRHDAAGGAAGTPMFLGAATLGAPSAITGEDGAPADAGFTLTSTLAPGTYTVAAYVWNLRTDRWEDVRTVRVVVK